MRRHTRFLILSVILLAIVSLLVSQPIHPPTVSAQADPFECNAAGSLASGLQLSFTLPACAGGSGECTGCAITCPANITVSNSPGQCDAVVSYATPTTAGD